MKKINEDISKQIEGLLDIGIALSAQKDHNKVLEMIVTEARDISRAEAGTLYLFQNQELEFKIIQNDVLNIEKGGKGEEINLPPVEIEEKNVAGYCALTKKVVNINNVYDNEKFNFSGPKKYDEITGYKTISMLVAPLIDNSGELVGVLQLINARDKEGKVIPFAPYFEKVISSLASQAAVSINNIRYINEIQCLLSGFVEGMTAAIDARTPYNASHSQRIAQMVKRFIEVINSIDKGEFKSVYFDQKSQEELIMSAWLHDIGKMGVPLTVMNKASRLEDRMDLILQRFDYIKIHLKFELAQLKNTKNKTFLEAEIKEELNLLKEARDLVIYLNKASTFVDDKLRERLNFFAEQSYEDEENVLHNWLQEDEVIALSVPKGTLTPEERESIEEHVNIASRILQAISFPERLSKVSYWVSLHHEYLDGSGYPLGLVGEEIPMPGRIFAIADIFDALIAADRPYKKAKLIPDALKILGFMVEEGKLDKKLFAVFKKYEVWDISNVNSSFRECSR